MWRQTLIEHYKKGKAFVAFSYPGDSTLTIFSQNDKKNIGSKDIGETGFVFAPFHSGARPLFLSKTDSGSFDLNTLPRAGSISDRTEILDEGKAKSEFIALVAKALDRLGEGAFKKVVLSRSLTVAGATNPIEVFGRILGHNPGAFCYWWFHPETGHWMGASPEVFLKCNGNEARVMSLAGTRRSGSGKRSWSEKELEEQQLVTDHIEGIMGKCFEKVQTIGPETVSAGPVSHLMSEVKGSGMRCTREDLILELHPTPAVCGHPTGSALEFLLQEEGYDRGYYTGYLGEVGAEGPESANLFVNLRSMQWFEDRVNIFVGAGITAQSDPLSEWNEIIAKSEVMRAVLFQP